MGDTGALMVGLLLFVSGHRFINLNYAPSGRKPYRFQCVDFHGISGTHRSYF